MGVSLAATIDVCTLHWRSGLGILRGYLTRAAEVVENEGVGVLLAGAPALSC